MIWVEKKWVFKLFALLVMIAGLAFILSEKKVEADPYACLDGYTTCTQNCDNSNPPPPGGVAQCNRNCFSTYKTCLNNDFLRVHKKLCKRQE